MTRLVRDQMYRMFNRALDTRDADVLWILNAVPALYPIRGEAEYQPGDTLAAQTPRRSRDADIG